MRPVQDSDLTVSRRPRRIHFTSNTTIDPARIPDSRADLLVAPPAPDTTPTSSTWLGSWGIRPYLLALDVLAVVVGLVATEAVSPGPGLGSPLLLTAVFGACLLLLTWEGGLHRSRLTLSVLDDLPRVVRRWLVAAAIAVTGQTLWMSSGQDLGVGRPFLAGALTMGAAVIGLRAAGYPLVRTLRARGLATHRTVIVGAGRVGNQVADILRSHPEYGLEPIGFVDADPPRAGSLPLPVLGGPQELTQVLRTWEVHDVVVAFSSLKESEMVSLIRTCDRHKCELFVVPRLFELQEVTGDMDAAWGFPLVRLRRATYRSSAWRIKRVVDVLVSATALLLLAPVLTMIALAVRLDGGPGVLFRQERVGVDGRHFELFKFRSLRPATDVESATTWNVARDPRLSRLGRFLRKSSLDELPQLVNILRGDMSLVGPRPERPFFVDQFRAVYPSYEARHRVPSGLTGWAQVHGLRGDTSIADRSRFDNYYIENWSLWLDLKIIVRTVGSLMRGWGG